MRERSIGLIDEERKTDHAFYDRLIAAQDQYHKVSETVVEPFTGKGFRLPAGHTIRIVLVEGPQVADLGLWSAHDPTETLNAWRTQILEGWFLRPHSRLWSDIPKFRPMATCLVDTVDARFPDPYFHHHFVGTHCSPEWMELRGGGPGRNACRVNLLAAIEPFDLNETHIRDNVNVHQKNRINPEDGRLFGAQSQGEPGDYIELYAEFDLIAGLSICPNADNTRYWSEPEDGAVKPLRVEIYDTGIAPKEFEPWHDWRATWQGQWRPMSSRA